MTRLEFYLSRSARGNVSECPGSLKLDGRVFSILQAVH